MNAIFRLLIAFALLVVFSIYGCTTMFQQPTTVSSPYVRETQWIPPIAKTTKTLTLVPQITLNPTYTPEFLPLYTHTSSPTALLSPLDSWKIGFTVEVIDKNNSHWEIQTTLVNDPQPISIVKDSNAYDPKWSPNGRWVAYISTENKPRFARSLIIDNLDANQQRKIENVETYDWSIDGQFIAYSDYGGTYPPPKEIFYYIVNIKNLAHPRVLTIASWIPITLKWSPKGDQILVIGYNTASGLDQANHMYLINMAGRVQPVPLQEIPGRNVSWHPDGGKIAYDTGTGGCLLPTSFEMW